MTLVVPRPTPQESEEVYEFCSVAKFNHEPILGATLQEILVSRSSNNKTSFMTKMCNESVGFYPFTTLRMSSVIKAFRNQGAQDLFNWTLH